MIPSSASYTAAEFIVLPILLKSVSIVFIIVAFFTGIVAAISVLDGDALIDGATEVGFYGVV
jgi:hypothetical protein